jgi:hypothetical protein
MEGPPEKDGCLQSRAEDRMAVTGDSHIGGVQDDKPAISHHHVKK